MRMVPGILAITALLLAGCTDETAGEGTGEVTIDVATLVVAKSSPVDLSGFARLAPDGSDVLNWSSGNSTCVRPVVGGDEQCIDPDKVSVDPLRAEWSSDGSALVCTDDYWQLLQEPDVWVFDPGTGDLRNLTDDKTDANVLQEPDGPALIDLLPSWSADGQTIRFARADGEDSITLMEVDAAGGEPTELRSIDGSINELTALAWSPDGETVAWTLGISGGAVHLGSATGDEDTVVVPAEKYDYMSLSFSSDGSALLADSLTQYGSYSATEFEAAKVVRVDGDHEVTPVADAKSVGFPTWSPTGSALAYIDTDGLYVVPEAGGDPKRLLKGGLRDGSPLAAPDGIRLNWTTGKMLLYRDAKPTLLSLSQ